MQKTLYNLSSYKTSIQRWVTHSQVTKLRKSTSLEKLPRISGECHKVWTQTVASIFITLGGGGVSERANLGAVCRPISAGVAFRFTVALYRVMEFARSAPAGLRWRIGNMDSRCTKSFFLDFRSFLIDFVNSFGFIEFILFV